MTSRQRKLAEKKKLGMERDWYKKEIASLTELNAKQAQSIRDNVEFLSTLETILDIQYPKQRAVYRAYMGNMGDRDDTPALPLGKRIIKAILALKEEFAREDEGTKIEAENKSMMHETIMVALRDPARLHEMDIEKEMVLAGMVKVFHSESGKFS